MPSIETGRFVGWIDRHPYFMTWAHVWCVAFYAVEMLIVFADLMHSRWRIMPKLTPDFLVWLGRLGDADVRLCFIIDISALVIMPILLKVAGRGDLARKVFFSILFAIIVTLALCFLLAPALFVVGMTIQDAYGKAGVTL